MSINKMLGEIRNIIAKCEASEKDVFEALVAEAEGWEMRLQELDEEIKEN